LTNNWRVVQLGTPKPKDFACQSILIDDEDATLGALLTWTNTAIYEKLYLYRDTSMFTQLPGNASQFVDLYAEKGKHAYAIRAQILASKSAPATCDLDIQIPPPPGPSFLRGDANGDGIVDISDAVFTLNYLFLGGSAPLCEVAGDSNDDGSVNISDPSYTLNYLFLGGTAIPSPFPDCGRDPTADTLSCNTPSGCPQ
jgi:hypothetical protein